MYFLDFEPSDPALVHLVWLTRISLGYEWKNYKQLAWIRISFVSQHNQICSAHFWAFYGLPFSPIPSKRCAQETPATPRLLYSSWYAKPFKHILQTAHNNQQQQQKPIHLTVVQSAPFGISMHEWAQNMWWSDGSHQPEFIYTGMHKNTFRTNFWVYIFPLNLCFSSLIP